MFIGKALNVFPLSSLKTNMPSLLLTAVISTGLFLFQPPHGKGVGTTSPILRLKALIELKCNMSGSIGVALSARLQDRVGSVHQKIT